ncbi:ATPase family protein 2 homolog [Drosophila novamexicana]|uniref:ATPase family protein 2 homolog n=1 Tax=Drosophila novamexicana TaxID=47314 RepID=UPI0011E59170|nr:ATPase family protein 2 homolog [Drosophila novamexicana]
MPPKSSNKKNQATWYHCEKCGVHITSKSRDTHERVCPIADDESGSVDAEFVRSGALYTSSAQLRSFEVESLKDLPPKYANMLIFVSEGAMQLAEWHIGQQVVIRPAAQESGTLVRLVWPVSEQFLTTVFASPEDYKQNWTPLRGKLLRISALDSSQLYVAASVSLRQLNSSESGLEQQQLPDVAAVLKQDIVNHIYCKHSELHLNFFNKPLTFRLESWRGVEECAVEDALARLSLAKSQQFVQITSATRLELLLSEEQAKPEPEQQLTKAKIGGLDKEIQLVEESMDYALGYRALPKGIKVSRGLLLYGASGCGKSLICEAMCAAAQARDSKVQLIRISSGEIYSKFLGETEQKLAAYFERAYAHYPHPTLLLLEDVHTLCPKQDAGSDLVKRVSLAFLSLLDQLSSGSRPEANRTFLLATSSQIDALHPSIRRAGRLDCELELGAPTPAARQQILHCLLQPLQHNIQDAELEQIASITHGYVGADLANLVYTATLATLKTEARALELRDLQSALTQVKPSAMREVLIESPNVRWSDIGGQAALRLTLQQAIEWPLLHADKFQRLGIKPPRGVLMFGPPGCSKTMIAKALATESQLNFLSIKGPELFSMWVGESERAVREVFRKARQVAPAIVFFDEIDAIGGERADGSTSGSSVKERVLTQLLTELDGVEALHNVTIVAATNRPDMIDKALLRPGRIDRVCYVGLPEPEARREILHIKLRAMPLAEDVDVDRLVTLTAGYSGAEIQAVCHEAALSALEQSFDSEAVHWRHFEAALQMVQPRTSPELLRLYQEYIKK